jgi:hypothetical protein
LRCRTHSPQMHTYMRDATRTNARHRQAHP